MSAITVTTHGVELTKEDLARLTKELEEKEQAATRVIPGKVFRSINRGDRLIILNKQSVIHAAQNLVDGTDKHWAFAYIETGMVHRAESPLGYQWWKEIKL